MLLTSHIKQLKLDFKKHFIHLYTHILYLIKNLFNINVNIKIFINYSYAQINKISLISFKTSRDLREFDNQFIQSKFITHFAIISFQILKHFKLFIIIKFFIIILSNFDMIIKLN